MILRNCLKVLQRPFSTYSKRMYDLWKVNPLKVHSSWNQYFQQNELSLGSKQSQGNVSLDDGKLQKQKDLVLRAYWLIRYFKVNGHQTAQLDPLNLQDFAQFGKMSAKHKLESSLLSNQIIKDEDMDIQFNFPNTKFIQCNIAGFLQQKNEWTLRQIRSRLQSIYSNKLGIELTHISSHEQKTWLMHQVQKIPRIQFPRQYKLKVLDELNKIQAFNTFLFNKIKTSKRFGVEGLDSMISGLNHLVEVASEKGIQFIGFGMAHRGRVNTLANVFQKPMQRIFAQYQQNMINQTSWGISGDVNYHLGTAITRQINDKRIRLSILPNPSHLQTVNAVAMGHVRAYSDTLGQETNKTLCVIIHGDAAISGQGVTYQALQMSYLQHYNTKGVIHIVANNQIGFTTTPAQARTGLYCTDIAKSIQAPVIHVNADQPELVHKAIHLALQYRQKFHKDIFVDIIGYRRYGHNQLDQPVFTQPMMYQKIVKRPNIYQLYCQKLTTQQIIKPEEVQSIWDKQMKRLKEAYDQALHQSFDVKKLAFENYHRFPTIQEFGEIKQEGINKKSLRYIGMQVTEIPERFGIHPRIKKIYDARRQAIQRGSGVDFGTAEALSFGSLLQEGYNVRLSGQNVETGTFRHRHAVLIDQKTQNKLVPLRNLLNSNQKHRVQIQNSLSSQYGALGFEYGYSLTKPNTLTIWQAQFGDLANGAQIMIDDYLASGENKWNIQTGLVLNLPHGMDGQGPQNSSCRIQRFLQLANDGWVTLRKQDVLSHTYNPLRRCNIQVVCSSTAANHFHAYSRQLRRGFRKPLINVINKKLLMHKGASSTLEQMSSNNFLTVIGETDQDIKPKSVKKVIITYGQAYYSALQKRTQTKRQGVAIVRIQQFSPFDYVSFKRIVEKYSNAYEFVWFQQEHRNSGPWGYIGPRISFVLDWLKQQNKTITSTLDVCSRKVSASTAVGKKKMHQQQQNQLLNQLFK